MRLHRSDYLLIYLRLLVLKYLPLAVRPPLPMCFYRLSILRGFVSSLFVALAISSAALLTPAERRT